MTRAIADAVLPFLPWLFTGGVCFVMGVIIYGNLTEKGRW